MADRGKASLSSNRWVDGKYNTIQGSTRWADKAHSCGEAIRLEKITSKLSPGFGVKIGPTPQFL